MDTPPETVLASVSEVSNGVTVTDRYVFFLKYFLKFF